MKNYKILTLLVLFLVGLGVASAAPAINITPDQVNLNGSFTGSVSQYFTVNNTGTENLSVRVVKYSLTNGAYSIDYTMDTTSFSLANGSSPKSIKLTIGQLSSSNYPTGVYTGNICVVGNISVFSVTDCSTISLTVNQNPVISVDSFSISGEQNSSFSKTFKVTNTGNTPLNNVIINPITYMDKYNITYDLSNFDLSFGESKEITLNGFIPYADSGITKGTLKVTSDLTNASSNITLTVTSKLKITEVVLTCNGEKDEVSTNGATFDLEEKCYPGSPITLKATIENTADEDVENIEISATLEGVDDDEDIESETIEISKLNDGDDKEITITFDDFNNKLPWIVDSGDYNLIIELTGENKEYDNIDYEEIWELTVPINRNDNEDLRLIDVSLSSENPQCGDSLNLYIEAMNIGTEDDEFKIDIKSTALAISKAYNFELNENYDDDFCTFAEADDDCVGVDDTYAFTIPSTAKGNYTIDVIAWSGTKQTDKQTLTLEVTCGKTTTTTTTTNTTTTTQTNDDDEVVVINTNPTNQYTTLPVKIIETSRPLLDKNSKEYPYIIAGGIVVILAILTGLTVMLTKKK